MLKSPESFPSQEEPLEGDLSPVSPQEAGMADAAGISEFVRQEQSRIMADRIEGSPEPLGAEVEKHQKEEVPDKQREMHADAQAWVEDLFSNANGPREYFKSTGREKELKTLELLLAKGDVATAKEYVSNYYIMDRVDALMEASKVSEPEQEYKPEDGWVKTSGGWYRDLAPKPEEAQEEPPKKGFWKSLFSGR